MLRGRASRLFPVSLYASLLIALVCLTRPELARELQRVCGSVAALPLRAWQVVAPRPTEAAESTAERSRALRQRLAERRLQAASPRPDDMPAGYSPFPVTVLARRGKGAAGQATELILAPSREDLAGCIGVVTSGEVLLGFLADRPVEGDGGDPFAGHARVELLHHRPRRGLPRRVPAELEDEELGLLRFLVEPASSIDRWPLRCELFDDPYLAARIDSSSLPVRSSGLQDDPLGPLPAGLLLGQLRVFGYRIDDGRRVVPIGLFVEPPRSPENLHQIVCWGPPELANAAAQRLGLGAGERIGLRLTRLPVPGEERERLFATSVGRGLQALQEGCAIVRDGRLLGVLQTGGIGFGVATAFGTPGHSWPLSFLPDEADAPVIDLVAAAVGRRGALVELRLAEEPQRGGIRGQLFSGAGGAGLPPGLWIGRAQLDADGKLTVAHLEAGALIGAAELCVGPAAGELR